MIVIRTKTLVLFPRIRKGYFFESGIDFQTLKGVKVLISKSKRVANESKWNLQKGDLNLHATLKQDRNREIEENPRSSGSGFSGYSLCISLRLCFHIFLSKILFNLVYSKYLTLVEIDWI